MKHKILSCIIFIIICGSGSIYSQTPNLRFLTKRIINMGQLNKDTVIQKTFNFINDGSRVLYIEKIYKSCSCTSVTINKKQFFQNEKGVIDVTIDTKNKIGEQSVTVHLITNTKESDHIIKICYFIN